MNKRNLNEAVHLSDEQKKALAEKIRAFYAYIREEEIGIIEEQQIIELFCEHMAPIVYNKALDEPCAGLKTALKISNPIIICCTEMSDKERFSDV